MTNEEILRQRRVMQRRIREVVAQRRVALAHQDEPTDDHAAEPADN